MDLPSICADVRRLATLWTKNEAAEICALDFGDCTAWNAMLAAEERAEAEAQRALSAILAMWANDVARV